MISTPVAIDIPLKPDDSGTIRVGGTRVTLESVIADFQRGSTPEEIVHNFPVLKVADVYYVIGYYLTNKADVDVYIQHQIDQNEHLRREWEAEHPPKLTKADLMARLDAKQQQSRK